MPSTAPPFRLFYLIILFVAISLHLMPAQAQPNYSFSEKRISVNLKSESLINILKTVSKTSGITIFFVNAELAEFTGISVKAKDKLFKAVLTELLASRGLTWVETDENTIVVKKKVQANIGQVAPPADSTIDISGRIINERNEPVIGATVLVKGTNKGSSTSEAGFFQINKISPDATLLISSVAYLSQEVRVKRQNNLGDIQLKANVSKLDETIIIAYGTTSQRLSTGNVSTVKAEDIEKQPVTNPLLALQGRVPGLFITQSTGYAGTGVTVKVQGQNSIRNGNDPLYVVDGVPFSSQLLPTLNQIVGSSGNITSQYPSALVGNPLSYINTSDIESIQVLKDADATAIYGSRAANGAILITTKKGKKGKVTLGLNLQTGTGHVARKLDLLGTPQYIEMRREALRNDNLNANPAKDYDLFNNYGWDTTRYMDWQKVLIGNASQFTNVQASLSGGTDLITMGLSATYKRETAVIPGNFGDQKGSVNFNIGVNSSNKKLRMTLSGNYLTDYNQLPSIDLTGVAITLPPNAPSLYKEGDSLNWAPNSSGKTTWAIRGNPVSNLENRYKNHTNNILANSIIEYTPIRGLDLKSSFGFNNLRTTESQIYPLSQFAPEIRPTRSRSSVFGNNNLTSWIIEPQANYKRAFGLLKLDLLIGATIQQSNTNAERLTATGYEDDKLMDDLSTSTQIELNYAMKTQYRYNAGFGRINLNWNDKYILNITGRRDGTSRFGADNLFYNFGSVGVAWLLTNEPFVKNNLHFISFGKLRGSYGTTGSDQIGDYRYLDLYSRDFFALPYQGSAGMLPTALPNPYLQWETTKKLQAGLDLGFLKDRILMTVNFFRNQSSNQLVNYDIPIIAGFAQVLTNSPATVRNEGWELSVNSENISTKNFSWSSGFNITIPNNKLVAFPNLASSTYSSLYVVGEPLSVLKAYKFAGVNLASGEYQFYNYKNEIVANPSPVTDKGILINRDPKYYGGFQNTFTYIGLSLDILLQFVKQIGANRNFGQFPGFFEGTTGNQPVYILDRWQKAGDIKPIQRYNSNLSIRGQQNNAINSDAGFTDASYIRLKSIALSWRLPKGLMKSTSVKDIQLYLQGQNMLTFTKYRGMDPETRSSTTLPPLKMITVGIRVTL